MPPSWSHIAVGVLSIALFEAATAVTEGLGRALLVLLIAALAGAGYLGRSRSPAVHRPPGQGKDRPRTRVVRVLRYTFFNEGPDLVAGFA